MALYTSKQGEYLSQNTMNQDKYLSSAELFKNFFQSLCQQEITLHLDLSGHVSLDTSHAAKCE